MTLRSILAASLLLLPLLATAHNFVDGQRVAPVGVADRGELILDKDKFSYKNWNSAQLAGKVRVVQHIAGRSSAKEKNANLIERLDGVPKEKRTARFVCAVAAVFPDGSEKVVRGTIEGYIGWEPEGENGFGYDPIFYVDAYGCSTAAMSREEKNAISHRGNALRKMKEELIKYENTGC